MKLQSQDFRFLDSNKFQSIPQLQILVIGDGSTGKTSLLNILTYRKYPVQLKSFQSKIPIKTQGCDIKIALRNLSNSKVLLKMIDLSGDKSQRQYLDIYISRLKLDAIIFCFDLTNLKTLTNFSKWIRQLTLKDTIQHEIDEYLDTDRSDFSTQNTTLIHDDQTYLINNHDYKRISIEKILQTPFIFIGCKLDLIPSENHRMLASQVYNKIQQFYQQPNQVILLSSIYPSLYSDQFNLLESFITRVYQRDHIEDFFIRNFIQSKSTSTDESFWINTFQTQLRNNKQLLCIYIKHFCKKLLLLKMKR